MIRVRAAQIGPAAVIEASYVQPPSGSLLFTNGNFYYSAGANDKSEFSVRFYARSTSATAEQTILVQPIPLLPAETDLLGVERKGVPDPESRDYVSI
jgi:hypothetical protein